MPSAEEMIVALSSGYDTVVTSFTTGVGTTERCLPDNPARWAVIFSVNAGGGSFQVLTDGRLSATFPGFEIPATTQMLPFTQRDYPSMPSHEWFVHSGVGGVVTIVEIIKT